MNTQIYTNNHRDPGSVPLENLLLACLLLLTTRSAFGTDSYQNKVLFTPSDSMLKAEAKGRIMIYDGLESEIVDRAMEEQFDRIDNMMFIRIHHTQDDGEYLVEDDGC